MSGESNSHVKPTLLQAFIQKKLAEYVEPDRKGTPRGEPIGFSKEKYTAALFCLSSLPVKKVAEVTGVSYGLLRKWRTEGPFWKLIRDLAFDFADHVIDQLKKRADYLLQLRKTYLNKPLDELTSIYPPKVGWEEFSDAPFYSILLSEKIIDFLLTALDKLPGKRDSQSDSGDLLHFDIALGDQYTGLIEFMLSNFEGTSINEKDAEAFKTSSQARSRKSNRNLIFALLTAKDHSLNELERKHVVSLLHESHGDYEVVEIE